MAEIRQKIVTFVIFTFICIFTNISALFMDNIHKYIPLSQYLNLSNIYP